MNYLYSENDLEYIKFIATTPPKKIWWDFTTYSFDYDDFYFEIETSPEIADTQNKSDEAIIGKLTKIENQFTVGEHTKLVCENKVIDELYIARTFLYLTTVYRFSTIEKLKKRLQYLLKSISGKRDPLENIYSKATASWEEIVCHPKSEIVKTINPKHSNLIDCGLLLIIEDKILYAFVWHNSFGFNIGNDVFLEEKSQMKDIVKDYELIKIK